MQNQVAPRRKRGVTEISTITDGIGGEKDTKRAPFTKSRHAPTSTANRKISRFRIESKRRDKVEGTRRRAHRMTEELEHSNGLLVTVRKDK